VIAKEKEGKYNEEKDFKSCKSLEVFCSSPWYLVVLLDVGYIAGLECFYIPSNNSRSPWIIRPAIAEIILIFRTHDKEEWRDYWQRVFDIRRIGKRWFLVILLTFPVLNILALLLSVLAGSRGVM